MRLKPNAHAKRLRALFTETDPLVHAFDYLRRIIDLANQFLDERGEWISSVKSETLLKAS